MTHFWNCVFISQIFAKTWKIGEHRNISDYENKSAKDLIKALRGSKPKLGIKKNKLKEIKEDFYNLRHKFSKKKQISIENFFMILKITDIFLK